MDVVKPLTLPAQQQVTIRSACDTLAPKDALDATAHRGGQVGEDGAKVLGARFHTVRTKALQMALTVIATEDTAAEAIARKTGTPPPPSSKVLLDAPIMGWLEKPPTDAQVDQHLLESGLTIVVTVPPGPRENPNKKPETVQRPQLTSDGRKAAYAAILCFRAASSPAPSSCAQRVYDIAMILARQIERRDRTAGGTSHPLVAGLILQAAG